MPEARLKAWGKEDVPLVEESGNTRASWTFVSPWALMGCTRVQRGTTDTIVRPVSVIDRGNWEKHLKAEVKEMSLFSSRRARRRTQRTTGWSTSSYSPGG